MSLCEHGRKECFNPACRIKELEEMCEKYSKWFELAQGVINQIDDYFEYAMESKKDQKKVRTILSEYTETLATYKEIKVE